MASPRAEEHRRSAKRPIDRRFTIPAIRTSQEPLDFLGILVQDALDERLELERIGHLQQVFLLQVILEGATDCAERKGHGWARRGSVSEQSVRPRREPDIACGPGLQGSERRGTADGQRSAPLPPTRSGSTVLAIFPLMVSSSMSETISVRSSGVSPMLPKSSPFSCKSARDEGA